MAFCNLRRRIRNEAWRPPIETPRTHSTAPQAGYAVEENYAAPILGRPKAPLLMRNPMLLKRVQRR
jgi:hypothetical protein